MPNPNTKLPLEHLINRNIGLQNGFGYDEFVRLLTLPKKRLSTNSIANIYNRNPRTIAKWVERWEEEK